MHRAMNLILTLFLIPPMAIPFLIISLLAFAVFPVLVVLRAFITFFTHQVSARSVILKLFVDFESKVWTTPTRPTQTLQLSCRQEGLMGQMRWQECPST